MTRFTAAILLGSAILLPTPAIAQSSQAVPLLYRFQPGQVLEFEITQQADIETAIQGQNSEATIRNHSVRRWRVQELDAKGVATIEISTLRVQMRSTEGAATLEFDSADPMKQPEKYKAVLNVIGKPLVRLRVSPQGAVLEEKTLVEDTGLAQMSAGQILPPLGDQPVKSGGTWRHNYEVEISMPAGRLPARQTFTLKDVKVNRAFIEFKTSIIAPAENPALQAQLAQQRPFGTIQFDVQRGLILEQQSILDETIVGFAGPASSFKIKSTSTERLISDSLSAKSKPSKPVKQAGSRRERVE